MRHIQYTIQCLRMQPHKNFIELEKKDVDFWGIQWYSHGEERI